MSSTNIISHLLPCCTSVIVKWSIQFVLLWLCLCVTYIFILCRPCCGYCGLTFAWCLFRLPVWRWAQVYKSDICSSHSICCDSLPVPTLQCCVCQVISPLITSSSFVHRCGCSSICLSKVCLRIHVYLSPDWFDTIISIANNMTGPYFNFMTVKVIACIII